MNYEIAIPSYKRAKTFTKKTLNFLRQTDIDENRVTVFVADETELNVYRSELESVEFKGKICIGVPTLMAQRNFMRRFYRTGEKIFYLDDDVEEIIERLDEKKSRLVVNLDHLIRTGFSAARSNDSKLWGIYPVANPYFMKANLRTTISYIVGCTYGQINDPHEKYDVTLEDKEDFERSILHWHHDRSLARLDWFAPKTRYYKEPGGMQETRTEKRVHDSAVVLLKRWPQYCKLNTAKKSNHTEIKLYSCKTD